MAPPKEQLFASPLQNLMYGAALQCAEAASLGMPLEVWKTRMGRFREERSLESLANVYKRGGVSAFWQGTSAKMVESASKGAVLLISKEAIFDGVKFGGYGDTVAGFVAGAGAGVCQTVVMSPCTYVVTSVVTCQKDARPSITGKIAETYKSSGIRGFYHGGSAVAFRQASNWASRQGITEFLRNRYSTYMYKNIDEKPKLSPTEELVCGAMGGALSTWNQPFEVARIAMQAQVNEGGGKFSMIQTMTKIVREDSIAGLYRGLAPRILLGVWQTMFMVSVPKMIRNHLSKGD